MNLFNKEKDLIFRITNMVLVIWLVVGMVLFWTQLTNILIKEEKIEYELYSYKNCEYYYQNQTEDADELCMNNYENYSYYYDNNKNEDFKQLFIFLGNIVIVSGVIYFMNRGKK